MRLETSRFRFGAATHTEQLSQSVPDGNASVRNVHGPGRSRSNCRPSGDLRVVGLAAAWLAKTVQRQSSSMRSVQRSRDVDQKADPRVPTLAALDPLHGVKRDTAEVADFNLG